MMNRLSMLAVAVVLSGFGVALAEYVPPGQTPATKPAEPTSQPSAAGGAIQATDTAGLAAKKGEIITVEGVIEYAGWGKSGKVLNVKFKDTDKDKGILVSAFTKSKEKLDAAFSSDAAKAWTGAKVQITGKLEPYGGKIKEWADRLQIIVQNPEQVKIVEAAPK